MKFTFYLFKKEVKTPEQVFREGKLNSEDGYVQLLPTNLPVPYQCDAYIQYESVTTPNWVKPMGNHFQIDEAKAKNFSNSLVLLIPVEDRMFAVTYGYGHLAIRKNLLEKDFGIRVVLNEINPAKIRHVESRDLDTTTRQTLVFSNRDDSIDRFKFETESDLIRVVGGIPTNLEFIRRFSGSESLHATLDTKIDELFDRCRILLESYQKQTYKDNFEFYDNVRVVDDEELVESLNKNFDQAFNNQKCDEIVFAVPESILGTDLAEKFTLQVDEQEKSINEIDCEIVFGTLNSFSRHKPKADEVNVIVYDASGKKLCESKLIDYVVFETEYNKSRYILMLGYWHLVDKNYYNLLTNTVNAIEEINDPNFLPALAGMEEGYYNIKTAKTKDYVLLDQKPFKLPGRSSVEICDLLTPNLELICVKIYKGKAAGLGHLFTQGYTSGITLKRYVECQTFVDDAILNSGISMNSISGKNTGELTYVLAIATPTKGKLTAGLPFYSKVHLLKAYRGLRDLGYKVKVYKIPNK